MSNCLLKSPCLLSLQTSGAKYVGNKMPESFQNFSVCLCNTFTKKKTKKTCRRLSRNLCISCQQCLWHTPRFYQGLWFGFLTVEIISSNKIIFFTYISLVDSLVFGFFMSPCYNRSTRYPILEKHGAKKLAVCENKGKQHKSRVMKKSMEGMMQKRQKGWLKYKF